MSRWTHVICRACWIERNPGRPPVVLTEEASEICCFCGNATTSGIYVREDPAKTPHCAHQDEQP